MMALMPAKSRKAPRPRRKAEAQSQATQAKPRTPWPDGAWLDRLTSTRSAAIVLLAAVLLFYSGPLFQERATIHWDAADYHYSVQKYFADSLRSFRLPFWTPYSFSGFPFLADIQVGAWYPLNWPFFLAGITPRAIEWELALHAWLACMGAFLLARTLIEDSTAALIAGVLYGFSGFFAAHSSHVGMFQIAALLPWLLWIGTAALRRFRWLPVAGACAACIVLAGYFQAALYALTAFALFVAVYSIQLGTPAWRPAVVVLCTAAIALPLTAIQTLPGLELTLQSLRASADYSRATNSPLTPGALMTLIDPNYYHAPQVEGYTGPEDITQFYFYGGLLLIPLAAVGLAKGKMRLCALVPGVLALWYAFGPSAGFYRLIALLPGYRSIRAPVHAWFVVALSLAILAGAGARYLRQRFPYPAIAAVALLVIFVDLAYWNMANNGLAYERASFDERYGLPEDRFRAAAANAIANPLSRIWAPFDSASFGPLNSMLDSQIEVSYGYNPLELSRYSLYMEAANSNPRLLDSLAVTAKLNAASGSFDLNPAALPRVYAPAVVSTVSSSVEAAARLSSLDPAKQAIVESVSNVPTATVQAQIRSYSGSEYRISYQASGSALLRIASPYFPGWKAEVDGRELPVIPVDLALSGVVVPAGSRDLVFRYEPTWFRSGLWLSAASWLATAVWFGWLFVAARRRRNGASFGA
jgi:Bacterial membrane protein YfhO